MLTGMNARVARLSLPWLLGLAGLLLSGRAAHGDDVLPQPAPAKRYEKLAGHSPFAPPSAGPAPAAPAATPPPGPSWSDNLTVTSLMQSGTVYTATVIQKDTSERYLIRSDAEDREHGLILASVRWAEKPESTKVTMRKGTQFGEVHFDPNATAAGPGTGAPVGPGGRLGATNPTANFRPPPSAQAPPAPPPGAPGGNVVRARPMIHANPPGTFTPPARPTVGGPAGLGRAAAQKKAAKDDDDDDDDN